MAPYELSRTLRAPLLALRTRCVCLACLRGIGLAAVLVLAGAVAIGWTDLIIALPGSWRLAGALVLLGVAAAVLCLLLARAVRRSTPRQLACALDRVGQTGGQIRAGVELAEGFVAEGLAPLTADLTRRAVVLAGELAARQSHAAAEPAAPALRPWCALAGAALLLAGGWRLWPEVVSAQAARVLDPAGEHLRYCPYRFEIACAQDVIYGEPLEMTARVAGADQQERFVWVVQQPGRKPWTAPLIARTDGSLLGNLSAVVSDLSFHIEGPRGRSPSYKVTVLNTPQITDVGVRVEYPAYTGMPSYEGHYDRLPGGGPSGVRGTKVTLRIGSNRPLSAGTLTLHKAGAEKEPALQVPMTASPDGGPNSVAGTFQMDSDLQFSAEIRDIGGLACKQAFQGRCLLMPDQRPRVSIIEPRARSYATPDTALPLVIEAEDDFGIAELRLYRSLNGSRDIPAPLPLPAGARRLVRLVQELPLADWRLDPGDVLEISAVAGDNDPQGSKTAQTPVHRVTMITRERYVDLLRQQETIDDLYERYKPWLDTLASLRARWKEAHAKKDEKEMAAVREVVREAVERLGQQLKEPPVFAADLQFSQELRRLLESLQEALKDLEQQQYDDVDRPLTEAEEAAKKALEMPLEMLVKLYRLIEDESLYTVLALIQEDLARRAAAFKPLKKLTDAQQLRDLQALLDEQREVRVALQRLVQDIRDHAGQLPAEDERFKELIDSANKFATDVIDKGIDKAQQEAETAMAAAAGTDSHAAADKAATLMMELVKRFNGGGGFGGQALDKLRPFGPHITQTVNQLLGARGLPLPGLGLGQGGQGGGYSLGSGNNQVGLYGNRERRQRLGGGGGKRALAGSATAATVKDAEGFGVRSQFDDGSAAAALMTLLPSIYRSAVRDFNQRVADDLAKKR